jgi:hypothetical protein
VEGIQVCSNEGNIPSPRGVNSDSKNTLNFLKKKSSPEPTGQIQSNLTQSILE